MRILKYIGPFFIIILFGWISLIPALIQWRYLVATNILFVLAFFDLWAEKGNAVFKRGDLTLLGFLITIGLNVLYAKEGRVALGTYLNIALGMATIYYVVSENFSGAVSFSVLLKAINIFSILVGSLGVIESFLGFNPICRYFVDNPYYERYITGFVRPMSTQYNPAPLGTYLLASLPFNFMLFRENKSLWKILGALGLVVNTAVLLLTFSRAAFLGLCAQAIFYLFMQRKYISMAVFSVILLILVFFSSSLPYTINRLPKDYTPLDKGTATLPDYRINKYLMAARMFRDHPFAGLGFQHFRIKFYEYYTGKNNVPYEKMIADNMYLTILTETGIIGFIGFLIFILSLFKKARRKLRILSNMPQRKQQLLLVLTSFIGLLVNMSGYELLYWPNPYIYFCILIGLIEANCRNPAEASLTYELS